MITIKITYNKKQTRENRKINDYFTHVSNNSKIDLACQKFFDIIYFIGDKMFKKKDREKYMDVTTDLYENDLIEYKIYVSIREDYEYSVKKDKNKDDFEIEM